MDPHASTPRITVRTRTAVRLGDAHEAVERLLDRTASRSGPADALGFDEFVRRLQRLLVVERRLLAALRRHVATTPLPATLDPLRADHRSELASLLAEARSRAAAGAGWPEVLPELADFLAWTFIAVEEAAPHE